MTNAQQPKTMKVAPRKHAAIHHRAKHKMARKGSAHRIAKKGSSHRLARKASAHRIAYKGSAHRVVKRSTTGKMGVASGKLQQPKQLQVQQSKKRMPTRETTGTGSAGSMQNISPSTTNPNMQK